MTMSPEIRIPHKIISDIGVLSCEHNRGLFCYGDGDWFGLGWVGSILMSIIDSRFQPLYNILIGTKLPSE
jgi:hypothetical protein